MIFASGFEIPSLSSFFELGENIGASWEEGSAWENDRMSLNALSAELDVDIADIMKLLKAHKIETSSSKTILVIALEDDLQPNEIMKII